MQTPMKTCTKCCETKPMAEFSKKAKTSDGFQPHCKRCAKETFAAWVAANYERKQATDAAWRTANIKRKAATDAAWAAANRARSNAHKASWRSANINKANAAVAAWRAAHPESTRIHKQNRLARQRGAGGKLSRGLVDKLFRLQGGKCACGCKRPLGNDYHIDHRMPLALGGTHTDDNIQLLRAKCNMEKGAKHPVEFMRQRGFLL